MNPRIEAFRVCVCVGAREARRRTCDCVPRLFGEDVKRGRKRGRGRRDR